MEPIEWIDRALFSNDRIVLTENELNIPGIKMFGRHKAKKEFPALVEHYHPDCVEFTYLASGVAPFAIGEEQFELYPGDLLITPAGRTHSTMGRSLALHTMYWFQVELHNPDGFLFCDHGKKAELTDALGHLKPLQVSLDKRQTEQTLETIFRYFCSGTQQPREIGATLLLFFLQQVLLESAEEQPYAMQTPDIIRAVNHISHHLHEPIGLDELARNANLSVSRFKQKFSKQMGTPPRVYINYQKVLQAKKLLENGRSITDTAMELGFSSSSYFSVVFKRYLGFSPSEFVKSPGQAPRGPEDRT